MPQATIFKNNQSQAVRLPKAVAFPDDVEKVEVLVMGNARLLTPVSQSWDSFFLADETVSDDFMNERLAAPHSERESF